MGEVIVLNRAELQKLLSLETVSPSSGRPFVDLRQRAHHRQIPWCARVVRRTAASSATKSGYFITRRFIRAQGGRVLVATQSVEVVVGMIGAPVERHSCSDPRYGPDHRPSNGRQSLLHRRSATAATLAGTRWPRACSHAEEARVAAILGCGSAGQGPGPRPAPRCAGSASSRAFDALPRRAPEQVSRPHPRLVPGVDRCR
jgi:hypothetical protein